MAIHSVYIISKSGSLIYNYDHSLPDIQVEKTFSYPLDLKLEYINQKITVTFGQRDGIKVGFIVNAINGETVNGRLVGDKDVLNEVLTDEANYPINIKFVHPRLTTNEKIVLASMFHSMYAIAALQICNAAKSSATGKSATLLSSSGSVKPQSSGIQILETDSFRLNCFQTLTGVKFVVISDLTSGTQNKDVLLKKMYELYSDFALKNPFYSLDMPIRCHLFDENLQAILEQYEKTSLNTV